MTKKHIITIGGKPGGGKSSTAKKIAQKLGYEHYSTGDFFREIAKNRGLTVTELNIHAEKDKTIDEEIDNKSKDLNNKNNLVVDSRMAFNFIPDSFKVYLDIDSEKAAKRMFDDMKENQHRKKTEDSYADVLELKKNAFVRYESENKRYKNLYNVNPSAHNLYDLVVDTGVKGNDLDSVVSQIIEAYKSWLA